MTRQMFAALVVGLLMHRAAPGGQQSAVPPAQSGHAGDWCTWLKAAPGTVYRNPDNPWLQELKVFSRSHFNYAWVDGASAGRDFWYSNRGEIRRFWPGMSAKFADGALLLHYELALEDDEKPRRGERHLSYDSNWALFLEWELSKSFPALADSGTWTLGYGKRHMPLAEEVLQSSKFMSVVERSAFSNRLFVLTTKGSSPHGTWLRHRAGRWSTFAGLYSTDTAPYWGDWGDGTAWFLQTERDITDWTGTDAAVLAVAGYHESTEHGDDRLSGALDWAVSAWTVISHGPWTWRLNAALAEGDSTNPARDGRFRGLVATTEYWLVAERLQAVARYQYQGADEAQGIQLYSRYARTAGAPQNENLPLLAGGYGDEHHALYLGLNWLACGHQLKFMGGVEWERLNSAATRVYDGVTFWLGLRSFY